jgi:putative DNA primase/helicase
MGFEGQTLPTNEPVASEPYKPDEDELALAFTEYIHGRFAFFRGDWYEYVAGRWEKRLDQEMSKPTREFLRPYRGRGIKVTTAIMNNVRRFAADDCFIRDEHIDRAPQYINLQNCLFNTETMRPENHKADAYMTWKLDFPYDPHAGCPVFWDYLTTMFVDKEGCTSHPLIHMFLEALGYSMTADTSLKASFWLVGPPDSGKSTLIKFLSGLMGDMHTAIDLNQIGLNRFLLASTIGKRVITCTEANAGSVLPDAIFKAMVGGTDEIQVDVKNKPAITFIPEFKVWWGMNDMPKIIDRSGAVFRRMFPLPFFFSIPVERRDPLLYQKLMEERSGIFNEAMRALERLRLNGDFTQAEVSIRFREEQRFKNDPEAMFIDECVIMEEKSKIPAAELQIAYAVWRKINGYAPKSTSNAKADFARLGLNYERVTSGRFYVGGKLNQDGNHLASKTFW